MLATGVLLACSPWPATAGVVGHHGSSRSDTTPLLPPVQPVDNVLYFLTQGDHCLDFHMEHGSLILYSCYKSEKKNQEWALQRHPGWDFVHVFTPAADGKCLAAVTQAGVRPEVGAPVAFVECDHGQDDALKWVYDFPRKMLHMSTYPDLCLDYNEATDKFGVYTCILQQNVIFGGEATKYNQVILVEHIPFRHDTSPQSPAIPVPSAEQPVLMTQSSYCLNYHTQAGNLILYQCQGHLNEQWVWKAVKGKPNTYQVYSPANGGKCLRVEADADESKSTPKKGSHVGFSDCTMTDEYELWSYDFEGRVMKLAAWLDMCLDYNEGSDNFGVYPCKMDTGAGEGYNQKVSIKTLPHHTATTVVHHVVGAISSYYRVLSLRPRLWSAARETPFAAIATAGLAFVLAGSFGLFVARRMKRRQQDAASVEEDASSALVEQ
eukprot:CAMPEP_0117500702 /NCGR_PEP_ID=MMETSP0784-20121206/22911_1 /TAXON_ID=39447 /ORGANISM="" /LENGTH=434 /DNA_ID=CAMNT_0005295917 /DNA_START=84 /DNA_END=1388 /DNA_ORIENTATION=-